MCNFFFYPLFRGLSIENTDFKECMRKIPTMPSIVGKLLRISGTFTKKEFPLI